MSTFYSDFGDMLPNTVLVSRKIGTDSYGRPTYGDPETFQARVIYGSKLIRDRMGEIVPASGSIWMYSRRLFTVEDKYSVLVDDEPSPASYTQLYPLRIDEFPDENGPYHSKVYFQ